VVGTIEGHGTFKLEQHKRVYDINAHAPTIHTSSGGGQHTRILINNRIRRLTPREYWRVMGFSDADFDKVRFQSDTQLYKQAGNSIVVPVLEGIFTQLFKGDK
jgi:DNA (cytosine-5)-methyltransferase 1